MVAIDNLGLDKALLKCVGMFAFALWDKYEKTLTLGRDRFGEKPLYYLHLNNGLVFGSELISFQYHPLFSKEINSDLYLRFLLLVIFLFPILFIQNVKKISSSSYKVFSIYNGEVIENNSPVFYYNVKKFVSSCEYTSYVERKDHLHSL